MPNPKLCLTLKCVMLSEFLVVCNLLLLGIKLIKYGGDLLSYFEEKT